MLTISCRSCKIHSVPSTLSIKQCSTILGGELIEKTFILNIKKHQNPSNDVDGEVD